MEILKYIIEDGVLTDCEVDYETGTCDCIVPEGITEIAETFLSLCGELEYLYLPASVEQIRSNAFGGCGKIGLIEISPENPVYYVEGNCIIEKRTKTVVVGGSTAVIPADIRFIGDYAFHARDGISNLTIPPSVERIGRFAFLWTDLKCLILPEGLQEIGAHAFALNNDLKTVFLPSTLTDLENGAFSGCNNIEQMDVHPDNVYYYEESGCVIERSTMALMICASETIPDGVLSIPDFTVTMLNHCGSLFVPESVQEIGKANFEMCRKLLIDENGTTFGQINFILRAPVGSDAIEYAKRKKIPYFET